MKKEVDIHGMSVAGARSYLKKYINDLSKGVTEIDIIHGYNQGKELQKFVRKDFNHRKIEKKIVGFNNGVTTFLLKRWGFKWVKNLKL